MYRCVLEMDSDTNRVGENPESKTDSVFWVGVENPTFVLGEDMTGYEITAPGLEPPMSINSEADTYANHTPQYINCHSSSTKGSEQQPYQQPSNGRQLNQSNVAFGACTGYSSCNDVPLTKNRIKSIKIKNFVPLSPTHEGEDDKGGYVQPVEVFNPTCNKESNCDDGAPSVSSCHSETRFKRKNTRGQSDSEIQQADLHHEENGYVSPTDASVTFGIGDGMNNLTGVSNENPYTGTPTLKRRELQRFDSGVVDCDTGRDSLPPTLGIPAPYRSRLSTSIEQHYEDIDLYRNQKKTTLSRGVDSAKATATKDGPDSMTVHIDLPKRLQRSQRPSTEQDDTQPKTGATPDPISPVPPPTQRRPSPTLHNDYTHTDKKKGQKEGKEIRVFVGVILALFFLVSVSLAISITLLIMQVSSSKNHGASVTHVEMSPIPQASVNENGTNININNNSTTYRVLNNTKDSVNVKLLFDLQSQVSTLKNENAALVEIIQNGKQETENKLNKIIYQQKRESTHVDFLTSKFGNQIDNITASIQSQGIGSLASCTLKSSTYNKFYSKGIHVETTFQPDKQELENNFVLFAFCTFMSMADVSLDVQKIDTRAQYRCRCRAAKKGVSYKTCTLHYWLCPRI